MKVLEMQVFRGPNIYSLDPVIKIKLDIEELEERPSNTIEGFIHRLLTLIPSLQEHRCSEGVPGGFITRLKEGTWMGHVIEHIALELQCLAGTRVGFGKSRETESPGVYNVVYAYEDEKIGLQAGKTAVKIVEHLVYGAPLDFNEEMAALGRIMDEVAYGPSTQGILDKAKERNIPFLRLDEQNLVQLGYGVHQRRIQATVTSMTNLIAVDIASNKDLTKKLLADVGIPVPKGTVVKSVEAARQAAEEIGFPVVLKPLNSNHGKGVSVNLKSPEEVIKAFSLALDFSDEIIVEKYLAGRDHRVLVIGGESVAVAERVPARVIGDGVHTLQELIDIENKDPRRGHGHEKALTKIYINEESKRCIAEQGYTLESIPKEGKIVGLKLTANISTGGTAIDRTDEAHYSTVEIAKRAARVIGLDVAGVDLITTDIARPLEETGGAICEINAAPGFRMHLHPTEGRPRDVAGSLLDMLFPPGTPSRIPIAAITGTNGKTTTARMLAHILKMSGRKVGLTTSDGIYIDGKRILSGDMTGPRSAQMVLKDPTVDFAVLETARGGILRSGLGFDRCNVGIITNISEDHLGLKGVHTLEDMAFVKSLVLETVIPSGYSLLNAQDEHLLHIAERAGGKLVYFVLNPENPILKRHTKDGGLGITVKNQIATILQGAYEIPVININSIPATFQGRATFNVTNALIAVMTAHLSGARLDDIRSGLKTFETSFYLTPGRLNIELVGDFNVILDYAHNPAAYRALAEFVAQWKAPRKIGIIASPGDRRDIDIENMGKIAGQCFSQLIIKEDDDLRGRNPGEVSDIVKRGALAGGMLESQIKVILNEQEAVKYALDNAQGNDLIVVTCDQIKRTFEQVVKFRERIRTLSVGSGLHSSSIPTT